MAHLTDRLVTEDDLKEILGISDAVDDNRLTMAADAATQMVQAFCDRHFVQQDAATARVFVASTPWLLEVDDISTTSGLVIKTDADNERVFETFDHIVPKVNGGKDNAENLVPCCKSCNSSKQAMSYDEFKYIMAVERISLNASLQGDF